MTSIKQFIAECAGTFILVFGGVGAVMANALTKGEVGIIGIALAFGFSIIASVYIFGRISGAHINPAVTISLLALRKINVPMAIGYIISQLAGATLAAIALWISFGSLDLLRAGVTVLAPGVGVGQGIFVEALLTFFLVLAVLAFVKQDAGTNRALHGAVTIGLLVSMDVLAGGFLTGASMNPARTFGPALISGNWTDHLVYWVGPILGGLAAVLISKICLPAGDLSCLRQTSRRDWPKGENFHSAQE